MSDLTKEETLSQKEKRIKKLIRTDERYGKVFNFIFFYYSLDNCFRSSVVIHILREIYINNYNKPMWKLACDCNISRTLLFKCRHEIVNNIEKLANPELLLPDFKKATFTLEEFNALLKQIEKVFHTEKEK